MALTEEQKKRLTEFIGECWHDVTDTYPLDPPGSKHCDTCEEYVTSKKLHSNRTFLTPGDQQACMEALVREGKLTEFLIFSSRHRAGFRLTGDSMPSYYTPSFIAWLFRPVNEAGEAHFCALAAEFLEVKDV